MTEDAAPERVTIEGTPLDGVTPVNVDGIRMVVSRNLPPGVNALIGSFDPGALTDPPLGSLSTPDGWANLATGHDIRESIRAASEQIRNGDFWQPTGLILHPRDEGMVRISLLRETVTDVNERRRAGEVIAEQLGMAYWEAGVEGYKPPLALRIKWLPGTIRKRVRQAINRRIEALPLVTYREPTDWGFGPPAGWVEPRTGWDKHYAGTPAKTRMWVRLGKWAIGWYEPEDY